MKRHCIRQMNFGVISIGGITEGRLISVPFRAPCNSSRIHQPSLGGAEFRSVYGKKNSEINTCELNHLNDGHPIQDAEHDRSIRLSQQKKKKKRAKFQFDGVHYPKPEIPEDLKAQWGAVEACAVAFNTLQAGTFTHRYMSVLNASLAFLQKLHEQSVDAALAHPQSDLIPELKTLREERAKNNGKTEEN